MKKKPKEKFEFTEIFTPNKEEYFYYPALPENCFTFKIRAYDSAFILLSEAQKHTENSIEISLGSQSHIRQNGDNDKLFSYRSTPDYLSDREFHHFWIKWMDYGKIEVGFVNGTTFLKLQTDNMPIIKYIGITSTELTDKWILEFDEPKCPDLYSFKSITEANCYDTTKPPAKLQSPLKLRANVDDSQIWINYQKDLLQQLHIDYENLKISIHFHLFSESYLKWTLHELEEIYKIAKENHKKIILQRNNYYNNDETQEYLKEQIYDNIKKIFIEFYETVSNQLNKYIPKKITSNYIDKKIISNDIDQNFNENYKHKIIDEESEIIYKQIDLNITKCSIEAIFPYPNNGTPCQCKSGWAGNGIICGIDTDNDGWPDKNLDCSDKFCKADNCPNKLNTDQKDLNSNGIGDVCDDDIDGDGIENNDDNCPNNINKNQLDNDNDGIGNECDNCPEVFNKNQDDIDDDKIGDVCDNDIDNDGIINADDNCIMISNKDQLDTDKDGVGDKCDNCLNKLNKDQNDIDFDGIGDVCDNDIDGDDIENILDNCPKFHNINQTDTDGDGFGDGCDNCKMLKNNNQNDSDNDGIGNECDNCPEVFNKDQRDTDDDKVGDACDNCGKKNPEQKDHDADLVGDDCDTGKDFDNDGRQDNLDNCPHKPNSNQLDSNKDGIGNACENDSKILDKCISNETFTSFSRLQIVNLDNASSKAKQPNWKNIDSIVYQFDRSDPSLAIGYDYYGGVDYEGIMRVNTSSDNGQIGLIFSYQSNRKFYLINWHQNASPNNVGLEIKAITSSSGPGTELRKFLLLGNKQTKDNKQGKIIWNDENKLGWMENVDYKWILVHKPDIGLIRLSIYNEDKVIIDSGKITDNTFKGGRLGFYTYGQSSVNWKNFKIKCNES